MHNFAVLALPRQEFSGVSHQYQRCGNLRQPTHPHQIACHPTHWILNFGAELLPSKMIGIANWIS
jgi:hypothetical protein